MTEGRGGIFDRIHSLRFAARSFFTSYGIPLFLDARGEPPPGVFAKECGSA
jgi:hypothetical protein